ncbi:MAG: zf-TFIIB domain-containing protein [Planctomycetes bacterium]|nr:zf-TFIIB domain-containing protein [Planctomycetota bacterium]
MNCPRCLDVPLQRRHESGVAIDACPRCRGAWLDLGTLEHLLRAPRRDDAELAASRGAAGPWSRRDDDDDDDDDRRGYREYREAVPQRDADYRREGERPRSGWRRLMELFD